MFVQSMLLIDDETVKLWDVRTGQLLATLHAPSPYAGMTITCVTRLIAA
ncbi:MAG: hypothetical protein U0350_28490 [Caldilineaceae bacterium]